MANRIRPNRDSDTCQCKRCRQWAEVYYYGYAICQKHWEKYCEGKLDLKEYFQIKEKKNEAV